MTASTAAKPQNAAILLDDDRIVVLKIRCPSDGVFYLDRLGHDVLVFGAEEGISLRGTPKIKVLPRFLRSDLFKLSLPAPQGVVPKKPKALIQVYFPGQTAEVGSEQTSCAVLAFQD